MTKTTSRRAFVMGAAGALATPFVAALGQASRPKVRFAVDWVWQGNHSIWTYAEDTGIFAGENVEPQLEGRGHEGDHGGHAITGHGDVVMQFPQHLDLRGRQADLLCGLA